MIDSKNSEETTTDGAGGMGGVARQTVVYGIGTFLGKSLSFLLLPVYTRFLSPADYGVMALIDMTIDVAMIVAGASLVQGVFRFYHKAESPAEGNRVVTTALVGLMITFLAAGLITFVSATHLSRLVFGSEAHTAVIRVASMTIAFSPMMFVPHAWFRMRDRAGIVVSSFLAKMVIAALMNIVLLMLGWGVMALFISGLTSTVLVGTYLTSRMLREVGYGVSVRAFRNLTRYGLPLVATNIATFTFTFGDRFLLQKSSSETEVGLYSFAYSFGFILLMLGYLPFMEVWQPRIFKVATRPDRDELYARGFIYANVMLLTAAAGIILFIGDFLRLMTQPEFYPAAALVPVVLVAYVLHAWARLHDIGILITERTEFQTLANWLAVGAAITAWIVLIPRYHAWGAVIAAVITFSVRYFTLYIISQRLWPVRYNWPPVFKLIGLVALVAAISAMLPDMWLPFSLVVRVAVFAAFLWCVWHAGILTESERDIVRARAAFVIAMVRRHVIARLPRRRSGIAAAPDPTELR